MPLALTVAVKVSVSLAPAPIVPTVHVGELKLVAPEPTPLTKVYPLGKASRTVTPVAEDGPALLNTTVKVTVSPAFAVETLAILVKLKSITGVGVVVTSSSSSSVVEVFPGVESGSGWSLVAT